MFHLFDRHGLRGVSTPKWSAVLRFWAPALLLMGLAARPAPAAPAPSTVPAPAAADPTFAPVMQRLERDYLDLLVRVDPVYATQIGLHAGDGALGPEGFAGLDSTRAALAAFEARVSALDDSLLGADDRFDAALMLYDLRLRRFEQDTLKVWSRDPGTALRQVASGLSAVAGREYAPLATRARALLARERAVPGFLAKALPMIDRPPRALVDQAVSQAEALSSFLLDGVPAATAALEDSALADSLAQAGNTAVHAVWAYREALLSGVEAQAVDGFALGPALFAGYLHAAEGMTTPLPRLRARAEDELARLDARFRLVAAGIDSAAAPGEVMRRVSEDHPAPGEVVPFAEDALRSARRFTAGHGAVPMPAGPPLAVRRSPAYSAWTNASLAVPGPFDDPALGAVFYVTVPDPTWPPEAQEEQLRFLNRPLIRNLAVHEAWPGHYLQALIQSRLTRPVRKAVWSPAFGEGWAHYAETLMLEQGYRADDPAFRLATLQSALRRAGRFRVALGLHTEGWTVDRAAAYLEEHCYLEPSVARREADRGAFDPLYLSYTLGKQEIQRLRAEVREKEGAGFDLERFHARLLALGAPPLPLARAMLLHQDLSGRPRLD